MDSQKIDTLIEHFYNEKKNGMEFTQIRKLLETKNIEENIIKLIIRDIDNKILAEEKTISHNKKAKEFIYIGSALCAIGLIITIGTYTHMFNMGDSFLLAYGPIFGGVGMILNGFAKYSR